MSQAAIIGKARRTVVFVGNCQAEALEGLYRRSIAPLLGERSVHLSVAPGFRADNLPPSFEELRHADVIVEQKFEGPDTLPPEIFQRPGVLRVRFPYVGGRFYWPYGGVPHPHPQPHPLPGGTLAYHGELGDSLLNKMILENVAPEDAVRRYDAVVEESGDRVLRLAELHFDRQRARDAECGMHFADFITANYQREPLFNTQGHPGLPMARRFVTSVFEAIGVPYALVDLVARSLQRSPFPPSELPIHPGVARILGLTFVTPDRRYRFFDEGHFTFAEFARRYMTHEWVPDLKLAMDWLSKHRFDDGIPLMRQALARCPGTSNAWRNFAWALQRTGEMEEAEAAIRHAMQLDRPDPEVFADAAHILMRRGDLDGAEAVAHEAIVRFPGGPDGPRALAQVLARRGRHHEAAAVARLVAAREPADVGGLQTLAHHLRHAERPEESEAVLRQALALDPSNAETRRVLDTLHPPHAPPPPPQPPTVRYRAIGLAELHADPRMRIDGQPLAQPLENLPAGTLTVPPLGFGETGGPPGESYTVAHKAAPAWLLRNVTVHGPIGAITVEGYVLAETLGSPARPTEPGARPPDDGAPRLPRRGLAGNVHTAFHLLGDRPDDYAHWLLDLAARFGVTTFSTLAAAPGAARAPIVLLPPLDVFWKWESLELILPGATARMALRAEGSLFVERLLYVPPLGGDGFATHPAAAPLFDAMRDSVAGPDDAPSGGGRRLFVGGGIGGAPDNEAELAERAERHGFARVAPAALPFGERVRLFAEASHVIAAHGEGLADLAFCRAGTAVCELRPGGAPLTWRHLAAVRGLRYGRLTGAAAPSPGAGWRLDAAAFGALLDDPRFAGN